MITVEGRNLSDPNFGASNLRNEKGQFDKESSQELVKNIKSALDPQNKAISESLRKFATQLSKNTEAFSEAAKEMTDSDRKNFENYVKVLSKSDGSYKSRIKESDAFIRNSEKVQDADTSFSGTGIFSIPDKIKGLAQSKGGFLSGTATAIKQGLTNQFERGSAGERGFFGLGQTRTGRIAAAQRRFNKLNSGSDGLKSATDAMGLSSGGKERKVTDRESPAKQQTELLEDILDVLKDIREKPVGGSMMGLPGSPTPRPGRPGRTGPSSSTPRNQRTPEEQSARDNRAKELREERAAKRNGTKPDAQPKTKKPGKLGNLLKKTGKFGLRAARFAGPVGAAVGAVGLGLGAYNAFKGFNADPNASLGSKFKNAGSGFLSGASFGLFGSDPEEIAAQAAMQEEVAAETIETPAPVEPAVEPAVEPEFKPFQVDVPEDATPQEFTQAAMDQHLEKIKSGEIPSSPDSLVSARARAEKRHADLASRFEPSEDSIRLSQLRAQRSELSMQKQGEEQAMLERGERVAAQAQDPDYKFGDIDSQMAALTEEINALSEKIVGDDTGEETSRVPSSLQGNLVRTTSTQVTGGETVTGGGSVTRHAAVIEDYETEESANYKAMLDATLAKQKAGLDENGWDWMDSDEFNEMNKEIQDLRSKYSETRGRRVVKPGYEEINPAPLPTGAAVESMTEAVQTQQSASTAPVINNITNNNTSPTDTPVLINPATSRSTSSSLQRFQDSRF